MILNVLFTLGGIYLAACVVIVAFKLIRDSWKEDRFKGVMWSFVAIGIIAVALIGSGVPGFIE